MSSRRATVLLISALALSVSACATKPRAIVVLLPEQDDGTVGRATVENPAGSVDLDAERDSTRVRTNQPPAAVTTMTEAEVQRLFGDALAALPPSPRRFVVNFLFQSDELTAESRALMPELLAVVRERPLATVVVTGHTDTMGTASANHALGLKRAAAVRNLLISAGLDASRIEVSSLGETDPLVSTKDETAEPRNRRVDITMR
jgi:outer membrane protein OmpA-like peptidoglycan-associated protein